MNLKIGIVGMPNVGKSTLFNALTKSQSAEAANFPFCTIDPNVGIVEVPDKRIDALSKIVNPQKTVRSAVEFVDIAGLIAGASQGEGLGNKFLSHIRECNAIAHVVRAFDSDDIHHVSGSVDPSRDLDIIMTELILADLDSVNKQLERVAKKSKAGDKESIAQGELLTKAKDALEEGKLLSTLELDEEDVLTFRQFQLLTRKPYMVIANVAEDQLADFDAEGFKTQLNRPEDFPVVAISAHTEEQLSDLEGEELDMFLEELGVSESGLERLIHKAFELLGLQSYFTAGVTEVRAWTIRQGDTAPQAAGAIHTDFERGFIKADVIGFDDFIECGGEAKAKENGKMKMQGKEYIMKDGDVVHFKFNV